MDLFSICLVGLSHLGSCVLGKVQASNDSSSHAGCPMQQNIAGCPCSDCIRIQTRFSTDRFLTDPRRIICKTLLHDEFQSYPPRIFIALISDERQFGRYALFRFCFLVGASKLRTAKRQGYYSDLHSLIELTQTIDLSACLNF